MEPPDARNSKNMLPIEIARLELAGGRVASIGNPHCPAKTKPALRKVQAVSHHPSHTIVRHPSHRLHLHTTLQYKILQQSSNLIISKSRAYRRLQPEATPQSPSHIVF